MRVISILGGYCSAERAFYVAHYGSREWPFAFTFAFEFTFTFGFTLKAQLHGSQFWRQFFLKSASRFQYSNLIGCVHANYDVIVNILGVRYLENRRTRFRVTAPLILLGLHAHMLRLG